MYKLPSFIIIRKQQTAVIADRLKPGNNWSCIAPSPSHFGCRPVLSCPPLIKILNLFIFSIWSMPTDHSPSSASKVKKQPFCCTQRPRCLRACPCCPSSDPAPQQLSRASPASVPDHVIVDQAFHHLPDYYLVLAQLAWVLAYVLLPIHQVFALPLHPEHHQVDCCDSCGNCGIFGRPVQQILALAFHPLTKVKQRGFQPGWQSRSSRSSQPTCSSNWVW